MLIKGLRLGTLCSLWTFGMMVMVTFMLTFMSEVYVDKYPVVLALWDLGVAGSVISVVALMGFGMAYLIAKNC